MDIVIKGIILLSTYYAMLILAYVIPTGKKHDKIYPYNDVCY
jgi:hypothetical protein